MAEARKKKEPVRQAWVIVHPWFNLKNIEGRIERLRLAGQKEDKSDVAFRELHSVHTSRLHNLIARATHPILILEEEKTAQETLQWAKRINPKADIEVIPTWKQVGVPKNPQELRDYFARRGIQRAVLGGANAKFREEDPRTAKTPLIKSGGKFYGRELLEEQCVGAARQAIQKLT